MHGIHRMRRSLGDVIASQSEEERSRIGPRAAELMQEVEVCARCARSPAKDRPTLRPH